MRALLILGILGSSVVITGCYELSRKADDILEEVESSGILIEDGTAERAGIAGGKRPVTNRRAQRVPVPVYVTTFKLDGVMTDLHTCPGGPTQARNVAEYLVVGPRPKDSRFLQTLSEDITGDVVINVAQHLFALHVEKSDDIDVIRVATMLTRLQGE